MTKFLTCVHNHIRPIATTGLLSLPLAAAAHHPLDEIYDRDSSVTLTGTVTRIDWINPHAVFFLAARDGEGADVLWLIEMDPPHALTRRGWTADSIMPGQTVSVAGFRAIDGSPYPRTLAKTVTLPGGETLAASADGSWMWRNVSDDNAPGTLIRPIPE